MAKKSTTLDLTAELSSVAKKTTEKKAQKAPIIDDEKLRVLVDKYNDHKESKKAAEVEMGIIGETLHSTVNEYRRDNGISGTIEIAGDKGKVLLIEQHKYGAIDLEMEDTLKGILGKQNYNNYIEIKRDIKLTKDMTESENKLISLIQLIKKETVEREEVVLNNFILKDKGRTNRLLALINTEFSVELKSEIESKTKTLKELKGIEKLTKKPEGLAEQIEKVEEELKGLKEDLLTINTTVPTFNNLSEVIEVKQYLTPTKEFTENRYEKLTAKKNQELEDIIKPTRMIK
jgi:hypothetical protein